MANQIELTAQQAAALDLMIAQKQASPESFIFTVERVIDVTPVVVMAATVTQVAGESIPATESVATEEDLKKIPLEQLIEIRKKALVK